MIDATAFIAPGAVVLGDVTLGRDSSVWYNSVLRGDMAPISVGDESNIQDLTMVHVDEGVPCTIGNRVGVGHRAILHGCVVEDESLVGMGAILLNGVTVGSGAGPAYPAHLGALRGGSPPAPVGRGGTAREFTHDRYVMLRTRMPAEARPPDHTCVGSQPLLPCHPALLARASAVTPRRVFFP